jgi:MFS family permease
MSAVSLPVRNRPALAIACLSASLFLQEVLLTRLFSVILYHHFAFIAISVGMLGLAAGGVRVALWPERFTEATSGEDTRKASLRFAGCAVVTLAILAQMGLSPDRYTVWRALGVAFVYVISFIPFYFGGVAIALVFTHSRKQFAKLYAIDLIAAGGSGLLVAPLLGAFGGPASLLLAGLVAALGGVLAFTTTSSREKKLGWVIIGVVTLAFIGDRSFGLMRVRWAKEVEHEKPSFEAWNAISRLAVYDEAFGPWALGTKYAGPPPEGRLMDIDASAATPILHGMTGAGVEHLDSELTAIGYVASPHDHSLVIGAGGGRDVLCALRSGMKHVDAIEINPIIANDVMRGKYKEYSGGIYVDPRVTVHVMDGRSFVRGSQDHFDVIQASLVDTWASTAAGAFALSENNLYTLEAITEYIDHLSPDGVLTLIRWQGPEVYRLIVMVEAAARSLGIADIGSHLAILEAPNTPRPSIMVTNLLFKKSAWDAGSVKKLEDKADGTGFSWAHHPLRDVGGRTAEIARAKDAFAEASRTESYELSPSTDDWPFFFYRPQHRFFADVLKEPKRLYYDGPYLLAEIMLLSALLAFACLLLPLWKRGRRALATAPRAAMGMGSYFVCIGIGFMFLEVSMMQRFVLFLGHPTYALTAVMVALLLGAGLGSQLAGRLARGDQGIPRGFYAGLAAAGAIALSAVGHPAVFGATQQMSFITKILLTQVLVLPLGVMLGTLMPLGVARLTRVAPALVPWAWGVNGFASVVGSCMAVLLSMSYGFSTTFHLAAVCYGAAAVFAFVAFRGKPAEEDAPEATEAAPAA